MKTKILISLFVSLFVFVCIGVRAQETSMTSPIFKIQAYSYDKISDMYVLEQYGSAVLITKDILLTNSHVITDNNDELTLQYEACQTVSDKESPTCFSTLQLLKYDKDSDLALLQIIHPSENMPSSVVLWSGTLSVGDAVHIVGYPANGWETITTTQWTIAWFENDYYKTDANVDEWNSWWGGFDSAWNFIWIPTYVVNWQTTLWYIIPTSSIKDFIGWSLGTLYKKKYSIAFDKRLNSIYALQTHWIIDNKLFTTPDFNALWLKLDSVFEKEKNNLFTYSLSNANGSNVSVSSFIATDNDTIKRYVNSKMKEYAASEFSPHKSVKKIGTVSRTIVSIGWDDWVGYDYIKSTSTNKTYLEFIVYAKKSDIEDIADLIHFVENISVKKISTKPQAFNFPLIKLSSKWSIGIAKWLKEDWLLINIFPKNEKYVARVAIYTVEKWDTLKTFTKQVRDLYDSMWADATSITSKYPNDVSITSVVDEDGKTSLNIFGVKKYGTSKIVISVAIELSSNSAKQEAITLGYKIMGLE